MLSPARETLGSPVKSSVFVNRAAPLGLEQVDHVQVLALRLGVGALRPQEVDVGVPAIPAAPVHVRPPLEA